MKKNIKGTCDACGEYSAELQQVEKTSMWACTEVCASLLIEEYENFGGIMR